MADFVAAAKHFGLSEFPPISYQRGDGRKWICRSGHVHQGFCGSTHGGSGGTRDGVCDHCHLLITGGTSEEPYYLDREDE